MLRRGALLIGSLFLAFGFVIFYVRPSFFYPDLPFHSVSKHTVVSILKEKSAHPIKKLATDDEYAWYGAKTAQGEEIERLKTAMSANGWLFLQQEGSGYFFERGNETMVITTRKWSGEFTLFQVPIHAEALPDSF